ncbi:hypothetical protein K491DRAFT_692431 [Lophiostoma macrostomum CBS 122681]|uniref:Secreted protein n=1 Tax=Lophiostoma macrostomum CBS 122681 TaxID=1314788 RepID=A0A6A6T9E1_9PLEO|nr:hypothetical protein K491DRAFT_692431 [Lophiostoma macrostomum CBS 122681]
MVRLAPTTILACTPCLAGWIASARLYNKGAGLPSPDLWIFDHVLMSALSPLGYSSESCGYCKDASSGKRRPDSRTCNFFFTSPIQLQPVTRASTCLCAAGEANSFSIDCRVRAGEALVFVELLVRLLAFTCVPLTSHPAIVDPMWFLASRGHSRVRPQIWVCMLLDVMPSAAVS